jgi:acetamidase/formamidase
MRRALRDRVVCEHSRLNEPNLTVEPGEIFEVETELCSGGWLKDINSVRTPEYAGFTNPTVVVAVNGAKPGDALRVRIHNIEPEGLGFTGFKNRNSALANKIIDRDWGDNVRNVRIIDGFVHFSPGLLLPIRPMIGTLGTAPADGAFRNSYGGRYGGNMDAQEVRAGAVVTLPVEVEGALLHIGDVHAIQGDGEICGAGGIECRSLVTLQIEVTPRPPHNGCIRVENDEELCAIACVGDLEECCVTATRELLYWICDERGMELGDAYLLLGQTLGMRVTQLVNPTRTIIATVPNRVLCFCRDDAVGA